MVVLPRRELNKAHIGGVLGLILAVTVLIGVVSNFSDSSDVLQIGLLALGLVAVAAIAITLMLFLSHRNTSKILLFHQEDATIVATNSLHEGFKLRFFRDVLNDNLVAFSDEEREQWSALSSQGFHPVFKIQNVRMPFLLPLCFMTFDEVFVWDRTNRWDYFDCRNTSEPTYSERGIRPFEAEAILPETHRQPAT